jgi:uncharacterized protein (TIGR01777 family)
MRVLISGASGLIGSALVQRLTGTDDEPGRHAPALIVRLVRSEPRPDTSEISRESEIFWDPSTGELDPPALEGFDAVVHLAGENIARGRWTAEKRARIRDSRVRGTRLLCGALAETARRPKVLVSASAVGYYGDRGDEDLDETSPAGSGFLADVCREWEAATEPAAAAGIRVVCVRLGVVLARHGGALARMLPIFRFGLGGRLGSGRQYMSWIVLRDAVEAICHAIAVETLSGPVNLVAPNPVTNRQFTKALGRALHRPTLFPAPAFMLRLALGEMADALLLASARVLPRRLLATGFRFHAAHLEDALTPRRH